MFTIPPSLIKRVDQLQGEVGRAWLASVPAYVERACRAWDLTIVGPPMHGTLGLVLPVMRDRARFALKIIRDRTIAENETLGLRSWDGYGVVQLHECDLDNLAIVLEWLDPRRTLQDVFPFTGAVEAGRLIRIMAIPAPDDVPRFRDRTSDLVDSLPMRWKAAGRELPSGWIDQAVAIVREHGPTSGSTLANWDLHFGNVLAADRRPWLVIDPMIVAADPELCVAQLLWTNVDRLANARELDRVFRTIVDAGDLDLELTRTWTMFRLVDYWLWGLGVGLTKDPTRCRRVIEWLDLNHG